MDLWKIRSRCTAHYAQVSTRLMMQTYKASRPHALASEARSPYKLSASPRTCERKLKGPSPQFSGVPTKEKVRDGVWYDYLVI